jgi:intracellular multiplication protein IcmP
MSGASKDVDQGLTMILIIMVGTGVIWLIWYFYHTQIVEMIRGIRLAELSVVAQFTQTVAMPDGSHVTPRSLSTWLSSSNADHLTWDQMMTISRIITPQFVRFPAAVVLLILAGIGYQFSPRRKLRRVLSLEDLIEVQAQAWPVTMPITKLNPATGPQRTVGDPVPAKLPPFAEALTPEEFIAFNHIPIDKKIIDRDAATRAFTRQLGPRWQGWDKLPIHYQALGAVFTLKGGRKRDAADVLLNELALAWDPKAGLRLSGALRSKIKGILKDPKMGADSAKIMSGHAFAVPGMFKLLIWGRERGGVLAPATFLWLRALDRNLWYSLNGAGRRTFHPEAAGAVAHYYAEKFLRRPLMIPKVQAAVDALVDYLKESDTPIPEALGKPPKPTVNYSNPRAAQVKTVAVAGGRA